MLEVTLRSPAADICPYTGTPATVEQELPHPGHVALQCVLREFPEGPGEVCKTGFRVRMCASANAIRDVLEELAASVEDSPLTVNGVIEGVLVIVERQLEDLRAKIVVFTAKGRRGIEATAVLIAEIERELVRCMGKERLEELTGSLADLRAFFEESEN